MRKLKMWQRLGIVISLLWIIGGGLWQRTSDVSRASNMAQSQYQPCSETASQLTSGATAANEKCMSESLKTFNIFLEGSWGNVAFFAVGPVLLAWLLAYLTLWTTRWVLAGRRVSN